MNEYTFQIYKTATARNPIGDKEYLYGTKKVHAKSVKDVMKQLKDMYGTRAEGFTFRLTRISEPGHTRILGKRMR